MQRVLIVEDDPRLLATLERALGGRFDQVRTAKTITETVTACEGWRPELVILDFRLGDGDARNVLDLPSLREPAPAIVAISGEALPVESFELAQRGVRAFLPKPVTLDELEKAIETALQTAPSLEPLLRQSVGHTSLSALTDEVRTVMVDEALARVSGSRRGAAHLLRTSRQLLQYLLRRR